MQQGIFQRFTGLDVQMVGGFVQQQEIGFGEHQPEQQQPRPLSAAKGGHHFIYFLAPEQENRQRIPDFRFRHPGMPVPDFIQYGFAVVQTTL